MKKILLSLCGLLSLGAVAQDISLTLDSPVANDVIAGGQQFNFDVTVTNNGSVAVTTSDTVLYAPTIDGSLIGTGGGGSLVYFDIGGVPTSGNASYSRSLTLNFPASLDGPHNFCGIAVVIGPNWNGVTETDTTNNTDCAIVTFDSGSMSINDGIVVVSSADASFATGKTFHARVQSVTNDEVSFDIYSLSGQLVKSFSGMTEGNGSFTQDYDLSDLRDGIYIVRIASDDELIASKKISLQ